MWSHMDDFTTYVFLATSFFFVALAIGLLARYRLVSQRITSSTDLGHDLWQSMEQRLKKQDERILDMMGRLEVVQSRVLAAAAAQGPPSSSSGPPPSVTVPKQTQVEEPIVTKDQPPPIMQQPESQASQTSQVRSAPTEPDETQLSALKLLVGTPLNTRQLTDQLKKSREHVARIMKDLFEMGLVTRNDSTKPFVYQLTDEGRRHLPAST